MTDHFESIIVEKMFYVVSVSREKVVKAQDLVAACEQGIAKMTANETRTPSYQNPLRHLPIALLPYVVNGFSQDWRGPESSDDRDQITLTSRPQGLRTLSAWANCSSSRPGKPTARISLVLSKAR